MGQSKVSRRGVFKDLRESPYEYTNPYGDVFKFPSQKKLDIYARDIQTEIDRMSKAIGRLDLEDELPAEIIHLLYRSTYRAFYRKVVR